jgi:hypothetical protein
MFPAVIKHIIAEYAAEYVLLQRVNLDKINWPWSSRNPAAIHLLEKNPDKIYWTWLSMNPAIFELNTQDILKIDF